MKNILTALLFFVSISLFSQNPIIYDEGKSQIPVIYDESKSQNTIIYDENKLKNWYSGSHAITLSTDKNLNIGWKWTSNSGIYIDLKSNFGLWAKDKPSDYDSAFDDLDWILYDMNSTFQDRTVDESSSVYVLNVGYNSPLLKTKSITLSLFTGPGLAIISEKTYDRYRPEFLNKNYYHSSKEIKTEFNINAGLELSFKDGFGGMIGYDSYTSAINLGITMPIVSEKASGG